MPPVARRPIATSLLVLLLVPAAATARTPRFSGVALGNSPSGQGQVAKHRFVVGDGYTLRLRDRRAGRTRYRVCLERAGRTLRCARGRTGAKGPSGSVGRRFAVAPQATGRYRYVWSVAGRRVASWSVRIGPGD
jgi:hypothetical protein